MPKLSHQTVALATVVLAACQDVPVAPAPSTTATLPGEAPSAARRAEPPAGILEGRYLVQLRDGSVSGDSVLVGRARSARARVTGRFGAGRMHGFAAELSREDAAALAADPRVLAVEPDQRIVGAGAVQGGAVWGLDRIDQRPLPLSGTYAYGGTASGVRVYVFDTGINYAHVEFGGRAIKGMDYVTSGGSAADCHGHGTHVAATIGGQTYGVAKGVTLVGVRILDCNNAGTMAAAITGLNWVVNQKKANPSVPMVVNMSVDGTLSSSMFDNAVNNAIAAGVTVVVAAGNRALDACTVSPARVPHAITVGASDASDRFASFSNHGSCVDLVAPGVGITSAWIGSTTAVRTTGGTSMAAPHVAGTAALYLSRYPTATAPQVSSALTGNATTGLLAGLVGTTGNRLLSSSFLGGA